MIYSIKKKLSARGFTLIELLVVIAIIGVLATVVLASLNTARRKSRDARRISDIKQLQLALELYFDGVGAGNYPTGVAVDSPCTNNSGLTVLVTSGYIASIPRDPNAPVATNCYRYASMAPGGALTSYHLAAILEDVGNPALNSDKNCDSNTAGGATGCTSVVGVGTLTQGIETVACTGVAGAAGTDRCYDVIP